MMHNTDELEVFHVPQPKGSKAFMGEESFTIGRHSSHINSVTSIVQYAMVIEVIGMTSEYLWERSD